MTSRYFASTTLTGLILLTALMMQSAVAAAEAPVEGKPAAGTAGGKMAVLLVTDGNLFLAKVLEANDDLAPVKTIKPADYTAAKAKAFDVIVFDRYAPAALPKAGGLLFVDALPPAGALKESVNAKGSPLTIAGSAVKEWKKDHPAMKAFTPMRLYFETARKLEVPRDWTTLLDGDKGPLIVADGDTTHRRQIVLAFDVTKSNWPLKPSFPLFIYNAMEYLAGR
jgi:hypothetical protein